MLFRSDRKSTRLNSSHLVISYAVFCLKKKTKKTSKRNTDKIDRPKLTDLCCTHTMARSLSLFASNRSLHIIITLSFFFFFFFLKDRAPPEFSPLPLPAAFPI